MRLGGAPGWSYTALRGEGQERDSVLRILGASEGLSTNGEWAYFMFQIKCPQTTSCGLDPPVIWLCKVLLNIDSHAHVFM